VITGPQLQTARLRAPGLMVLQPEPNFFECKAHQAVEYMAAGIPVIASDFPFVEENYCRVKQVGGLLVNPQDPLAIARAIEHYSSRRRGEAMGKRGRQAVASFTTGRTKADTAEVYRVTGGRTSLDEKTGNCIVHRKPRPSTSVPGQVPGVLPYSCIRYRTRRPMVGGRPLRSDLGALRVVLSMRLALRSR